MTSTSGRVVLMSTMTDWRGPTIDFELVLERWRSSAGRVEQRRCGFYAGALQAGRYASIRVLDTAELGA